MPTPYGPNNAPTIAGNTITVDAFLNNPTRVQRTIERLTLNRFLADRIYSEGPRTDSGAVLYDQVLDNSGVFMDRDVQAIEPLAEFPVLNSGELMPKVATVTKWGGRALISYEAARRDRRDVLNKELTRLRNTIIRKVDTVAIAALDAAPLNTQAASGDWTTAATDIISDLETARSTIDNLDMGYETDTVILNPAQALDVRKDADIRAALPRERMSMDAASNLLGARDLAGLLGFRNWFVSNRQPAGQVKVLASGQIGGISDELPLYSRVVDEQLREAYSVMAARIPVPYVTDPKAVVKITGA